MKNPFYFFSFVVIFIFVGSSLILSGKIYAQPSLNIFSGYGKSSFEDVAAQTEYLPVGVQLMFGVPVFNFGIEANYAAIPFTFNVLDSQAKKNFKEIQLDQLYISSIVKINLAQGSFIPYGRLGCGLYTGKELIKWTDDEKSSAKEHGIDLQDYKVPLKNSIGFNIGGGFELMLGRYNGLFFEYVYHIISRKENIPGGLSFKANNWVIQAGYKINFI